MEHMLSPELAATQEQAWERTVQMWVLGTQILSLSKLWSVLPYWVGSIQFQRLAEKSGREVHVGLLPRGLQKPEKATNCARASQLMSVCINQGKPLFSPLTICLPRRAFQILICMPLSEYIS